MDFLNENDSLAYFAIFGELSLALSFGCRIFQEFNFSLVISWLFQRVNFSLVISWLFQRVNFSLVISWLFQRVNFSLVISWLFQRVNFSLVISWLFQRVNFSLVISWLFQRVNFSLVISWLFQRARKHPNVLVGLKRPNIRREIFLVFCSKFERHTSQRRLSQKLGKFSCYICSAQRCIYV